MPPRAAAERWASALPAALLCAVAFAASALASRRGFSAEANAKAKAVLAGLFRECVVFCGRECPVPALEFLVLSCGGKLGWEGEGSPISRGHASITHQIIDRPMPPERMRWAVGRARW